MSAFGLAVQTAMFNRLNAAGLPGNQPVYTVVPDEVKPPATVIAESDVEPEGHKNGVTLERHIVTVRHFMTGTSKAPLLRLMKATVEALDGQPLPAEGAQLAPARWLGSDELRDVDSAYLVGSQLFLVMARPA